MSNIEQFLYTAYVVIFLCLVERITHYLRKDSLGIFGMMGEDELRLHIKKVHGEDLNLKEDVVKLKRWLVTFEDGTKVARIGVKDIVNNPNSRGSKMNTYKEIL